MKRPSRRGAGSRSILLAASALLAQAALAQLPAASPPPESEPEPYQDRIIESAALATLPPDDEDSFDATGLPRSWRMEAVTSQIERGDQRFGESGLAFGGLWDTATLGSLSLDASIFTSDRDRLGANGWVGSATLWQRNLRFNGGWRADTGLGVLNTPLAPIQRSQYRFFLPGVPFFGATTQWAKDDAGLALHASLGRAGAFTGSRIVAFDQADGNVAALGAQWRWGPQWNAAISGLATDGRLVPDDLGGPQYQDGRTEAVLATTEWTGGAHSVEANLQGSRGYLGDAFGAWVDAESRRGRRTYNYGLFRLEPGLAWGAQPINNDAVGGYFRINYQHARWTWNAGLDRIDSVSGGSFAGYYGSAFVRYQARANLAWGGSASVRDSAAESAYSLRGFVDRRTGWGMTRLQVDQAQSSGGDRGDWLVTLDQDLLLRRGSRLAVTASYGAQTFEDVGQTQSASLAALGGLELGDRVTLDGNVRWTRGSGPEAFRGTDLNLSLNWRVARHWWLAATAYRNSGEQRSPFLLDPLAPPDLFLAIPRERSVFLSLRYERQSGSPATVLGGSPGAASGSIRGTVFLDDNGDGVRSASEVAAANITLVLDGRYSVRTDSQGNFEFPRVAVGTHQVTVVPDNLPLPWFLDEDLTRPVQVKVREVGQVDFGARRDR